MPSLILTIRVTPRSSRRELIKLPDGTYKARLTSAPTDGKANDELIALLSNDFKVAKSLISITKGLTAKTKTVTLPKS